MKNTRKITLVSLLAVFVVAILTAFCFAGCGNKNVTTYFLDDVLVNDTFEITVKSRGGTPYEWHYEINGKSGIEYIAETHIPENDDPDVMGGVVKVTFTFKATKTGFCEIKLIYQIIGEDEPPLEINLYKIQVVAYK